MTCRELADILHDYLAQELADEQRARIQSHLDACPECVHFVQTYQLTIQVSRQLPPAPLPAEVLQRLQRAVADNP